MNPPPTRERSQFHINLPFNRISCKLSHQFRQRGVDVSYSNKDSVRSRINSRKHNNTNSGVYVLTCDGDTCQEIYVGQSKDINDRFSQHASAKTCPVYGKSYASATHSKMRGHDIDPAKGKRPYLSTSLSHRLVIETCLISLCRTVNGNKATSNVRDMDIIAPIVLRASPVDWKVLSEVQPSLNIDIVPRKYRPFFSPNETPGDAISHEPANQTRYYLRSSAVTSPESPFGRT